MLEAYVGFPQLHTDASENQTGTRYRFAQDSAGISKMCNQREKRVESINFQPNWPVQRTCLTTSGRDRLRP